MNIYEAGLLIYQCEGSKGEKNKRMIEFTNANPSLIQIFLKFLRSFGTEKTKIKLRLMLHVGDDPEIAKDYWSAITGIPKNQFQSAIFKPQGKGRPHILPHGTLTLRYYDAKKYRKLMSELDCFLRSLI